jgi:hypothetical protein
MSRSDPMSDKNDPKHDSPMQQLWMSMVGASAGDHHEEAPGFAEKSKRVGHEPDQFDARVIWYVPVCVAIVLVVVYVIIQSSFSFLISDRASQAGLTNFNERAARISTTDARPLPRTNDDQATLPGVAQPRLEMINQVDLSRNNVNGDKVIDPPFVRSYQPTPTGNSPHIYPEDLRAEHFVDPTSKTKALVEPNWLVADKVVVVPIDEMIHLMTTDDAFKLKVTDNPVTPMVGTLGKPKMSTGGVTPPASQGK